MISFNFIKQFDTIATVLVSLVYCFNRFWLKNLITFPVLSYLLKCHFNDWLAGIGAIAYFNLVFIVSKYRHIKIKTFFGAVMVCFICGVLWEYVLPQIFSYGTSDIWDVVSYMLGGTSYIALFRSDQRRQMKQERDDSI